MDLAVAARCRGRKSSRVMEPDTMIPFLRHLARESARVIMPHFASPNLQVERKADDTPVTVADREAEEVLRAEIAKAWPDHGIVGEELDDVATDAEYTWVLDPIDGTRSFAAGSPLFGTLICLRHGVKPLWGAIHIPALGKLYIGNNKTAWLGGRELRVRETPRLADCTLLTTDPKAPHRYHEARGWDNLLAATGMYRSWGDCFGYTLLASGGADIMTDPVLNLWDVAALLPVLHGCGAAVSDWHGRDPLAEGAEGLVAAHPRHHAAVIALLRGVG